MVYLVYGIFPGTSCPQTQFFTMWSTSPTCPPQTPFTFGLNQRAPYTAGDRCLLCRCERKDSAVPPEAGVPGQNGTSQLKTPSALQLPLWVCSDCRRTVEKEDRHTALEQSLGVSVCVCVRTMVELVVEKREVRLILLQPSRLLLASTPSRRCDYIAEYSTLAYVRFTAHPTLKC